MTDQWDDTKYVKDGQILKVDHQRWTDAQEFEKECWEKAWTNGSDYQDWWQKKFDGYDILENNTPDEINAIEVGCGPFTNIRIVESVLQYKTIKITLSDPLMDSYLNLPSCWTKDNQKRLTIDRSQLEDLKFSSETFDLLICVNVLDHVEDVDKCFNEIHRVLKKDGILILGQDLTDWTKRGDPNPQQDQDKGHPVRINGEGIEKYLVKYAPLLNKIVESRNPQAHYGCLCYAGKKI
jgi:ubiquinone/menaquinone biosynthesis C-methylase UbiE